MSELSCFPKIGDKASLTRTISEADIAEFANIIGDHNPVHFDDTFAAQTRFKGRIAHGMLVASLMSAVLGNNLPGPGTIYLSQNIKFLKPVRPGDTITATVEVIAMKPDKPIFTFRTICVNQTGENVIDGEAVILLELVVPQPNS